MASLIVIVTFFFSLSSATRLAPDATPSLISQACRATRYPEICESSLAKAPPNPNPTQIVSSAIAVSAEMVQEILESPEGNPNVSTAAARCVEVLRKSAYRTQLATDAFTRGKIRDVRAWMSASLLYQNDCFSSLVSVNSTLHVNNPNLVNDSRQMIVEMAHLQSLIYRTSNALSIVMAYENFGNNVGSWKPPATERDGFWEVRSGSGAVTELGLPKGLTPDVTVCNIGGGKCNYGKVQEAVDAAPGNLTAGKRFVIAIKEGVYDEIVRVPLDKTNLVFLGDGIGKTVITGSRHSFQPEVTTYTSATVAVVGDGFMASGLTIQNTASGNVDQAVAFRSESDRSIIENCEFIGNQDTLYAYSLRQFYKSCVIQGNLDFIFGNAAAIFQDCTILIRPRQVNPEYGERNAVTAHARTDPAQTTGFVFHNCSVKATNEYASLINKNPVVHKNFLGRPWKEYARTIFIHCHFEAFISPKGWRNWVGEHALKTLHYGEFENFGPGAVTKERESWSSQIPPERVSAYSVQNFIQGDEWVSK